jgi:hypothetical protein
LYRVGGGVPRNPALATQLFQKACPKLGRDVRALPQACAALQIQIRSQ